MFVDVTNDMTIAREEIFGPVLSVISYEDDDDAVRTTGDMSVYYDSVRRGMIASRPSDSLRVRTHARSSATFSLR